MKTKVTLISRFLIGLLLVAAVSLATAEATRGSGKTNNGCNACTSDFWCGMCCYTPGSVCLGDGQCMCA